VPLERYAMRVGSGGAGRWKGGDGGIRRIRFLESMTVSIVSNDRRSGPWGLHGGHAGLPGLNRVERAEGHTEALAHIARVDVRAGDVLVIETPGGGGFGAPSC